MRTDKSEPAAQAARRRIGRYTIVRPLSKGGMALVYEGRRDSLEGVSPRVAIKIILPNYQQSDTFRELFINEARLGASMQHQNLVQIQDFDCEGETYFLVMEYVEGLTLRKIIALCEQAQISIPVNVIAEIGRQACDGLHFAHTASDDTGRPLALVHRDMKPSNLILSPHGVVKVLDFGISKGVLREERKGSVKGTWGYMAPEQAEGRDIDAAADVFGLATVLYELASRRPMFTDQGKDEIKRLLNDDHAARVVATLDGRVYGPLISVLVRALQRDPKARFETAEEFGRALSALLPDPITARDGVVQFYQVADALDRGVTPAPMATPATRRPAPDTPADTGSALRSGPGMGGLAFLAGAAVSVLVLTVSLAVVVALFGQVAQQAGTQPQGEVTMVAGTPPGAEAQPLAVDEPAGPAGAGAPGEDRPPPLDARRAARPSRPAPPPPEPEEAEPVAAAPTALETTAGTEDVAVGTLVVGAKQEAEVYIDGRFIDKAPVREDLPVGTYEVTLVAADSRRRLFEVEVRPNEKIRKVWDFDRMEWR